jgi:hypothetical protein
MSKADEALQVLALDSTSATTLVADDSGDRHFIAESLLIAGGLFLLEKYAAGFLKGLGLDDLAEHHGRKARELFDLLRSGPIEPLELELWKTETETAINEVRAHVSDSSVEAQRTAEDEVKTALIDGGTPSKRASEVAARASLAVLGKS